MTANILQAAILFLMVNSDIVIFLELRCRLLSSVFLTVLVFDDFANVGAANVFFLFAKECTTSTHLPHSFVEMPEWHSIIHNVANASLSWHSKHFLVHHRLNTTSSPVVGFFTRQPLGLILLLMSLDR